MRSTLVLPILLGDRDDRVESPMSVNSDPTASDSSGSDSTDSKARDGGGKHDLSGNNMRESICLIESISVMIDGLFRAENLYRLSNVPLAERLGRS